jgi:hypothetical protein
MTGWRSAATGTEPDYLCPGFNCRLAVFLRLVEPGPGSEDSGTMSLTCGIGFAHGCINKKTMCA